MGFNFLQIVEFFRGGDCVGIMWACSFIKFYCWHVCLIKVYFLIIFWTCYLCFFATIILDAFRKIPIVFSILLT